MLYVKVCLVLPVVSNFVTVSKKGMLNSMSRPKIAAPGEAFSTVWYVERMVHAASVRNTSMSLGSTILAMSCSAVQSMVVIT